MEEKFLEFTYKARYHQLGTLNEDTQHLIFALHGYGQLAKFFLRKFSILDNGKICIIAPEGLSRFYLEGFQGRVGATWMTKEDRETDIQNYVTYLNQLYLSLRSTLSHNTKITILGFSQGSATASRWIASKQISFDQLILWAGIFPPDMDVKSVSGILKNKQVVYVYGKQDTFITPDRLNEMKQLSDNLKVTPTEIVFDGDHTINDTVLSTIFTNNS